MWGLQHGTVLYKVRIAGPSDAPALRQLLNDAYKELGDAGLNYTATYQDDEETARQISECCVFVLEDGAEIVGTIGLREQNQIDDRRSAHLGKFAVGPTRKRRGLGAALIAFAEGRAREDGYLWIQLDTAKPATHLVTWYQKLGYQIVGEARYEGKTYSSWIFEKAL